MSKCAILNPSYIITSKAVVSSEWTVGKVRLKKLHDVVTIQMAEIYNILCISFFLKKKTLGTSIRSRAQKSNHF